MLNGFLFNGGLRPIKIHLFFSVATFSGVCLQFAIVPGNLRFRLHRESVENLVSFTFQERRYRLADC